MDWISDDQGKTRKKGLLRNSYWVHVFGRLSRPEEQ